MSIFQEYEKIRREVGEEMWARFHQFLDHRPDYLLSDVLYKRDVAADFEAWLPTAPAYKIITIRRAEGPKGMNRGRYEAFTWKEANQILREMAATVFGSYYDKVDFTVQFANETHKGRYDLTIKDNFHADLYGHIESECLFYMGQLRPKHMKMTEYTNFILGIDSAPYESFYKSVLLPTKEAEEERVDSISDVAIVAYVLGRKTIPLGTSGLGELYEQTSSGECLLTERGHGVYERNKAEIDKLAQHVHVPALQVWEQLQNS
ncbi:hypothetical protein [Paenibacillus sp. GXUN7292]|uniref:hypothetical protein n=1 Tax=Paenibacillus sp. GXUN7292 TaxID=3422499 RepID=UPI003D7D39BD